MRLFLTPSFAAFIVLPAVAHAESPNAWLVSADFRAGPSFELSGSAPSSRIGVIPVTTIKVARLVGPMAIHGALRAGPPPFLVPYGQLGLGGGLGPEFTLSRRQAKAPFAGSVLRVVVFALLEGGMSYTYIDAPPEAHLYPDAVIYWGPYGRVETGLCFLVERPGGRELGWGISIAGDATSARYQEPEEGQGIRLGVEAALSGEVRF